MFNNPLLYFQIVCIQRLPQKESTCQLITSVNCIWRIVNINIIQNDQGDSLETANKILRRNLDSAAQ